MARSHKIYMVIQSGGFVMAAFTVKHELVSYLEAHRAEVVNELADIVVVLDGVDCTQQQLLSETWAPEAYLHD